MKKIALHNLGCKVNSYEIEKNGYAHIVRNAEKSTLTLITCKHNTNKQIVVIWELVEVI